LELDHGAWLGKEYQQQNDTRRTELHAISTLDLTGIRRNRKLDVSRRSNRKGGKPAGLAEERQTRRVPSNEETNLLVLIGVEQFVFGDVLDQEVYIILGSA
jgi:hypothetical protein